MGYLRSLQFSKHRSLWYVKFNFYFHEKKKIEIIITHHHESFPARSHDGSRIIFDDFRESYWWLRMNTPENAKVMSWWDYGYQITAMANRTILVDNNTWNNTHISRVGQAMVSMYVFFREVFILKYRLGQKI